MQSSLIKNAQVLFGSAIPVHEDFGDFTLAWSGAYPGETIFDFHNAGVESNTIFEVRDRLYEMKKWNSAPINIVLADRAGNIGYMLLSASPQRKNDYPYVGCSIIDGTSSKHDWEGIIDVKQMPMGFNPKKGYYMTANQRVVPENSKFDYGASMVNTGRSVRLNELI